MTPTAQDQSADTDDSDFFTVSAPPYTIDINCNDQRWLSLETLKDMLYQAGLKLPKSLSDDDLSLSLLLTDDDEIRQLNNDFRQKDKATNVLSFPDGDNGYLGDIAISYDRVAEESQKENKPLNDHFVHLFVHGCLHLMGYDHENEDDAIAMELLEIKILHDIGIKNPYT